MNFEEREKAIAEIKRLRSTFPEDAPLEKLAKFLVFEDELEINKILEGLETCYFSFEDYMDGLRKDLEDHVRSKQILIQQSDALPELFWTEEQIDNEKIRLEQSNKIVILEDLVARKELYKTKHGMEFNEFAEIKVRNWEGKSRYIVFDFRDELTIAVTEVPFWKSFEEDLWDEDNSDYIFSGYEEDSYNPASYQVEGHRKAIVFESRGTPYYELIKQMAETLW